MTRFIEECSRTQSAMFPEQLEDYINAENPVRVIDAFVDGLELRQMGFDRVDPKATGRPGYRPSTLLKLYVYGYLNRIQSSRRLERESQRNVELMWLIGRLTPDFKTIADFRKDNGPGIQRVCREFVGICRKLDLFAKTMVAIDGSKFKGVNSKQRNDTQGSMKRRIARAEKHIQEYMDALDAKDGAEPGLCDSDEPELKAKLASLREHLEELKTREKAVKAHPDKQLSETDPDARLMKQSRSGSLVGYNVQTAVDTENKLIIAHEVTNSPTDRGLLLSVAELAKTTLQADQLTVLADRGYFKGTDILACAQRGIQTLVPKPKTSNSGARGLFAREAFVYEAHKDQYRCPAGEVLSRRHSSIEKGLKLDTYYASNPVCRACKLKSQCTVGVNRRVRRWEHEAVLEKAAADLASEPDAMKIRARTVEHPFGTMKFWMGSTHFLMKRLPNVKTEMSLHVLVYNLRRMISILGVPDLITALRQYQALLLRVLTANAGLSQRVLRYFLSRTLHGLCSRSVGSRAMKAI